MKFGKRSTRSDTPELAEAISDATAVGISQHKIQEVADTFAGGSRTVDFIENGIEMIEALKARSLANDADDGNLLNQPTGDVSQVPYHQTYEGFNESDLIPRASDVGATFLSPTDKTKESEGVEFSLSDDISTADAQFHDQNKSDVFGHRPASEPLADSRLGNVAQIGKRLRAVPFSELLTHFEELVPGFIEKGVATMLSGLDGTHKSRLALQLGLCIQAGLKVFGKQTAQATFIYLDYENGGAEVARRLQKINSRLGLSAFTNGYYHDFRSPQRPRTGPVAPQGISGPLATVAENVHLQPFYYELREYLRAIPGHKFLVADSTHDILQFSDQPKIRETTVKEALTILDDLCAATDTTMLHILRLSPLERNDGDASHLSWMWENMARARLSINKLDTTEDAFVLRVENRSSGTAGTVVTLHWSEGVLLPPADFGDNKENKPCERNTIEQHNHTVDVERLRFYGKDKGMQIPGCYPAGTDPEITNMTDTSCDEPTNESIQAETSDDVVQKEEQVSRRSMASINPRS